MLLRLLVAQFHDPTLVHTRFRIHTTGAPLCHPPPVNANTKTGETAGSRRRAGGLDGFFKFSQRGSTVPREIRGGVVTFLTMAYIIVLNPIILLGRRT